MSKKNAATIEAALAQGFTIQEINRHFADKAKAKKKMKRIKSGKQNPKAKIFLGLNTNAM